MGQKVNPHGLRVGVIKNWDSRWFAEKGTFGDTLVEDYNVRNFILKELNTRSKNPADKCVYAADGVRTLSRLLRKLNTSLSEQRLLFRQQNARTDLFPQKLVLLFL